MKQELATSPMFIVRVDSQADFFFTLVRKPFDGGETIEIRLEKKDKTVIWVKSTVVVGTPTATTATVLAKQIVESLANEFHTSHFEDGRK